MSHELTLMAGDRRRTITVSVGEQLIVTSFLEDSRVLRVCIDGDDCSELAVEEQVVHLLVDDAGRVSLAANG